MTTCSQFGIDRLLHGWIEVAERFLCEALAGGVADRRPPDGAPLDADRAHVMQAEATAELAARDPAPCLHLRTRLGITASEELTLWLLTAVAVSPRCAELAAALCPVPMRVGAISAEGLRRVVHHGRGPLRTGFAELSPDGRLSRLGVIELAAGTVALAAHMLDRMLGGCGIDPRADFLALPPPALDLDGVIVPSSIRDRARAAAADARGQRRRIVVQGRPGSGRRTLARAIASAAGYAILELDGVALATTLDLSTALRTALRECALLDRIPLIADADRLDPDAIDRALRDWPLAVLATTTKTPAWRRAHPTVVIDVPATDATLRDRAWDAAFAHLAPGVRTVAAEQYAIGCGEIIALGQAWLATEAPTAGDLQALVRARSDERLAAFARRVRATQQWEDLALAPDQHGEVRALLARARHQRRVLDDWGFRRRIGGATGIAALLSGPPGTGKTMLAGLIANELGLDLYQIDVSRITSKYIGETEQHLAAVFDAAEHANAAILFDEADSLFGKRTDVKSATDRYANTEVNYLLQRLESFAGVCLLTTNHETAIDEAFRRRLTAHLRLPMPGPRLRASIWRSLLPEQAAVERAGVDFAALAGYELSGGYIKNAVLRAAFTAAAQDGAITMAHLRDGADAELAALGRLT